MLSGRPPPNDIYLVNIFDNSPPIWWSIRIGAGEEVRPDLMYKPALTQPSPQGQI
jgi:hypothetical protein